MCPFWEQPPPHTPPPVTLETIEASIRVLMARHAGIQARGFDSTRDRRDLHNRIDALLDQHAMTAAIQELVGP